MSGEKAIQQFPYNLTAEARQKLSPNFLGYLQPGENDVIGEINGVPVKEVKIHANIAILSPGEAAISGKFALCSAVIAKKSNTLYVMHIYPKQADQTEKFIERMKNQNIIRNGDHFDQILLIGREAILHSEEMSKIANSNPQVITLGMEPHDKYFNLLVFNNPNSPGDITSFDLWFDE